MRSCPKYQYSRFNASFPIGSARYNAVSHYDDLSGKTNSKVLLMPLPPVNVYLEFVALGDTPAHQRHSNTELIRQR